MKTYIPYSLLLAAAASGLAFGQTAYTTPVGYITHTFAGNAAALSAGAVTYLSPSLIQPNTFAGLSTASPSGTKVITFSGGVPAGLNNGSLLEINTVGPNQGWWSTIASSTATTVTVVDTFPAALPAATSASVRKHTTVKDFFGSNAPGFVPFDGVAKNDEVLLLNPLTQVTTTLAYVPAAVSGAPSDGFFDLGSSTSADSYVVEPGSSVQVKRFGASGASFVSSGTVKTTSTQIDLYPAFNWIGTFAAAGQTLNGLGFNTQLIIFNGGNTNYDQLQYINSNQSATTFAAVDPSFFGTPTVGNLGDSSNAGATPFKEGAGAIIIRASGESSSIITVPGSVVSQ